MSLQEVAAGQPVEKWENTRENIIEAVAAHLEFDFEPQNNFTDPLTRTTHSIADLRQELSQILHTFPSPPFTIQRIAELALLEERPRQYGVKDVYKYLHALLRTVSVASCTEDFDLGADIDMLSASEDRHGVLLDEITWASDVDPSEITDGGDDDGHMSAVFD